MRSCSGSIDHSSGSSRKIPFTSTSLSVLSTGMRSSLCLMFSCGGINEVSGRPTVLLSEMRDPVFLPCLEILLLDWQLLH